MSMLFSDLKSRPEFDSQRKCDIGSTATGLVGNSQRNVSGLPIVGRHATRGSASN